MFTVPKTYPNKFQMLPALLLAGIFFLFYTRDCNIIHIAKQVSFCLIWTIVLFYVGYTQK